MSVLEKRFAAVILAFGVIMAVIGYFDETIYGMLMLLASVLYVAYMYFTSKGDDT